MDKEDSQDTLRALLDGRMKLGNDLLEAAAAHRAAQAAVAQAERDYADAHKAALAGGWTSAELRKAGLRPIAAPRKKRSSAARTTPSQSGPRQEETTTPASTEDGTG
ncbi:MAG: hypothetical protein ACTHYM_14030 [Actinomycetaceae bacterium]